MSDDSSILTHLSNRKNKTPDTWKFFNLLEIKKTTLFIVFDTICVMLFTFIWFSYIDPRPNAFSESFWFVFFMTLVFFMEYYTYDEIWDKYHT